MQLPSSKLLKLRFEQLETRTMLTGTVYAAQVGQFLNIVGDAARNRIVVHQIGANSDQTINVQIQGISTRIVESIGSPIGEIAAKIFLSKNSVIIHGIDSIGFSMGDGNDLLTFYNTTLFAYSIDMGAGNDYLSVTN